MVKEQDKSNNDDPTKKKVTMDEDKLKKGMAAIFPSATSTPMIWLKLLLLPMLVLNDSFSCGSGAHLRL